MRELSLMVVVAAGAILASADLPLGTPPAAQAPSPAPAATERDDLAALEEEARGEAAEALARLELVLARRALRTEQHQEAARQALRALVLLAQVPPTIDVSPYELQAEGILARAARAGVDVESLRRNAAVGELALPPPEQDRVAAVVADPRVGRLVEPGPAAPLAYQRALEEAYKDSEARALLEALESRVIPKGEVSYPDNWPEIVRKRAKCAGGMIARSGSWWDDEGREWYVAVYDISDLLMEPAFHPAPLASPLEASIAMHDREALRRQSYIFRGDAYDLAAGLPLLRYFGGVFDTDLRPRLSEARRQRIIELLKAFTETPAAEARIVPLAP